MDQDTPLFEQDIGGCLAARIGAAGLADPGDYLRRAGEGLAWLRRQADLAPGLPWLHLPDRRDDLPALAARAARFRQDCDHVVILGTGGSSLGGKTLYALVDHGFGPPVGTPGLIFMDNIDPDSFAALLRVVNPSRLGVVVISKSGGTAETLAQFLVLADRPGPEAPTLAITEPGNGILRCIAADRGVPVIDHDPALGGRFSVLGPAGILPAMIAGLDAAAVRAGAARSLRAALAAGAASNPGAVPAAVGAAVSIGLAEQRGVRTTVLLPYRDRLGAFGMWYRQLWAESLGKEGRGTTPVRAMGTVDQHSQLQLYLDGPADKMFTLLTVPAAGTGDRMTPPPVAGDRLDYLAGRRMGDLLDAEQRATADTLIDRGRPTRTIALPRLDEASLGALMMHFMLETVLAAHLLGVDAFSQPAVEDGKVKARRYLAAMP